MPPLVVELEDAPGHREELRAEREAIVRIFDGQDRIAYEGVGSARPSLAPGIYTIRVEQGERFRDRTVRHPTPDGRPVRFEPVAWYTSAPLLGSASSHEYYRGPAADHSGEPTGPPLGSASPLPGRLFVFVRAPSREHYASDGHPKLDTFSIGRFGAGGGWTAFTRDNTKRSETDGWLAFSADAEPGSYVLVPEAPSGDASSPQRMMALTVFPGIQTQVFVTHRDWPLMESARIYLSYEGVHFDAEDETGLAYALELALATLQNPLIPLPRGVLYQGILNEKFRDPMLGLVGAHLLFRRDPLPDSIATVLDNLKGLLGGGPDLQVLRAMHCARLGTSLPPEPVTQIPMLRASLQALVELSYEAEWLIPPDGRVAEAAAVALVDSPWCSWPVEGIAGLEARRARDPATDYQPTAASKFRLSDLRPASVESVDPGADDELGRRLGIPASVWRARGGLAP
jgi:hypothetical protein